MSRFKSIFVSERIEELIIEAEIECFYNQEDKDYWHFCIGFREALQLIYNEFCVDFDKEK